MFHAGAALAQLPANRVAADEDRRGAERGAHVPGRHLRPSRRRLRPLFHRRALARAPFREDALRQRPASRPALPCLAGDRRAALRRPRGRDRGLGAARDAHRRGRVRKRARRRFRGRRGQVLRLERDGDRRVARRGRGLLQGGLRRDAWRKLGGEDDPQPAPAARHRRDAGRGPPRQHAHGPAGAPRRPRSAPVGTTRCSPTGTA